MDDRNLLTGVRGITGGAFYGDAVGNVEGNLDMRKFLTIVQVYLSNGAPNQAELIRWIEGRLEQWVPHVEALKRIEPAVGRDTLLAAYATQKHPLAAPPAAPDDTALFYQLVDHLAYRFPFDGAHPLLIFADALAQTERLPNADRAALRRWLAGARQIWPSDAPALAALGAGASDAMLAVLQSDPALLIALDPDDDDETHERLRLRAWVWLGPGRAERIGRQLTGSYTLDELRARMCAIYQEAQHYAAKDATRMTVEFFLPRLRLSMPVHEWPAPAGIDADEEVWLCSLHRVVVRPLERNFSPSDAAEAVRSTWRAKWSLLREAGGAWQLYKPDRIEIYQKDNALFQLLLQTAIVGYVETLPLPAGVDHAGRVLKRVVDAGLPISIWLRAAPGMPPNVYEDLDTLAAPATLPQLRDKIRELRGAVFTAITLEQQPPPLGAGIVLLWDDPTRLPPQHDLFVSPGQP